MANFIITDNHKRYDLEKAEDLGISTRENRGYRITSVHKSKGGAIIVGTYSIWQSERHDGTCVGQSYHVADADEIARLAAMTDNECLIELVPEGE